MVIITSFPEPLILTLSQLLSETAFLSIHTAERQEYARRSRASEEVMREKMMEARSMVDEEKLTKKELSSGKCAW